MCYMLYDDDDVDIYVLFTRKWLKRYSRLLLNYFALLRYVKHAQRVLIHSLAEHGRIKRWWIGKGAAFLQNFFELSRNLMVKKLTVF